MIGASGPGMMSQVTEGQSHFEMTLGIGAEQGNRVATLLCGEAGAERSVAGHLRLANGCHRSSQDGANEPSVRRDGYRVIAIGDPKGKNQGAKR